MASAGPQRLALHASARRTLGELEGDTLMALLPPANTEIALRSDVNQLGTELRAEMALLGAELELRLTKQVSRSTVWTIGALAPFIIAVQAVGVMMLR
jgi:hypothetical protein